MNMNEWRMDHLPIGILQSLKSHDMRTLQAGWRQSVGMMRDSASMQTLFLVVAPDAEFSIELPLRQRKLPRGPAPFFCNPL